MTSPAPIALQSRPALAPQVRLRVDPISGDPVLLYPEGLLVLSATAADIVGRCDGKNSVAGILAQMRDDYAVDEAILEHDVLACLADLARRTLLIYPP
jgi:coenzyme PQQ biosynthesis protein PqqD